jgi:hypothetical protein
MEILFNFRNSGTKYLTVECLFNSTTFDSQPLNKDECRSLLNELEDAIFNLKEFVQS